MSVAFIRLRVLLGVIFGGVLLLKLLRINSTGGLPVEKKTLKHDMMGAWQHHWKNTLARSRFIYFSDEDIRRFRESSPLPVLNASL